MLKKGMFVLFILCLGLEAMYTQEVKSEVFDRSYLFNIDTLFQQIPRTKGGADSLLAISGSYLSKNLRKSTVAAKKGLRLAEKLNYGEGIIRAHYLLGITSLRFGKYAVSMQHLLKARTLTQQTGNKEFAGLVLNVMANFYFYRKNYDKAAEYYKKAIAKQLASADGKQNAATTMNLGIVYYFQGKYKKSLKNYKRALNILKEADKNGYIRMVTLSNMGNLFIGMGKYRKAENNLLQANKYFTANKFTMNQAVSLVYLAILYHQTGSSKALGYAKRGIKKAKGIGYKFFVMKGYRLLADIYGGQNNYQKAFSTYKQYKIVQDSLLSSKMATKIHMLKTEFEIRNKNQKIKLLQKHTALKEAKIKQQNLWNILIVIGLVLSLIIAGLLYLYSKKKKQANALLEQKNQRIIYQNEKLTELDKEKDELLGIVAHDLRNPLSGILGAVDLLKYDDISKTEADEYNEMISVSSGRMLSLVDSLLDLNEVENRVDDLNITEVQLTDIINEVANDYIQPADQKGIALAWQNNANAEFVKADEEALRRILNNLISNAIKYSPSGSLVKVAAANQGGMMKISVKDNGPGIVKKEQEKLFKRFSRLSTRPTAGENSTGLGLFIVKKLVENMNGSVECKSKAGEGAEFIVRLPTAQEIMKYSV